MSKPQDTNKRLRNSILDLLCYYAVFDLVLNDTQILSLLSAKASMVGVRYHLRMLQKRGKVECSKDGLYSIKKIKYQNQKTVKKHHQRNIANAKHMVWLIKLLPFIKSVMVTSDYLLSTEDTKTPRLIILCSPNRLYITMDVLSMIKKLSNIFQPKAKDRLVDPPPMFFTTAGIKFAEEMGYDELSIAQWFVYSRPLYGKVVWETAIRNNPYVGRHLPNYIWKKQDTKYITSFSRILDHYDNRSYRRWLKAMAKNNDYKQALALLRVRPDAFIARRNHFGALKTVQYKFTKNQSSL